MVSQNKIQTTHDELWETCSICGKPCPGYQDGVVWLKSGDRITKENVLGRCHSECFYSMQTARREKIRQKFKNHINSPMAWPSSESKVSCYWCGALIGYAPKVYHIPGMTCGDCKKGTWSKIPDIHLPV